MSIFVEKKFASVVASQLSLMSERENVSKAEMHVLHSRALHWIQLLSLILPDSMGF